MFALKLVSVPRCHKVVDQSGACAHFQEGEPDPPFGHIFAGFMIFCMLGRAAQPDLGIVPYHALARKRTEWIAVDSA